jgi:hypothetical protein
MADIETYKPDEPSGITTGDIVGESGATAHGVTIENFGIEHAQNARHYGRTLAQEGLDPVQAEAEIWREAWQQYPGSRFFARCFAREATQAYESTQKAM